MQNEGPLKLYVNKALVVPWMSLTAILYPFWGMGAHKENILYLNAALKHGYDKKYFELVDTPQEAEYVLMPHEYWRLKRWQPGIFKQVVEEAQKYNKPLLIDASGDEHGVVEVPNARVLRITPYRFDMPAYEIKVPVPCEDLLEQYCGGTLTLRKKGAVPSVGFVGWGKLSPKQRIRSLVKEMPLRLRMLVDRRQTAKIKGVFWREKANAIFRASQRIKSDFIIRSSYSGNTATIEGQQEKNRREFVENILNTDYTLVVRGDANEATRFYEVLSLGRIPVLIDTAVVLPLEHLINYREFCVIIDWRDLKRAPDILADFHAALTNEQFNEMQRKARDAFERYLRYDAFSKHLAAQLRTAL